MGVIVEFGGFDGKSFPHGGMEMASGVRYKYSSLDIVGFIGGGVTTS